MAVTWFGVNDNVMPADACMVIRIAPAGAADACSVVEDRVERRVGLAVGLAIGASEATATAPGEGDADEVVAVVTVEPHPPSATSDATTMYVGHRFDIKPPICWEAVGLAVSLVDRHHAPELVAAQRSVPALLG